MAAITTERLGGRIRSPPVATASKRLVPREFLSERPSPDLSSRRGSTGQLRPLRACRQQELLAWFCAQGPSAVRRNRAHSGGTKPFQRTRQIRRCQKIRQAQTFKAEMFNHFIWECVLLEPRPAGHTPSITAAKRVERNQNLSRTRGNIGTTNTGENHQAYAGLVRQRRNAHGQPGGESLAAPSQRLKVSVPRSCELPESDYSCVQREYADRAFLRARITSAVEVAVLPFESVARSSNCPEIRLPAREPNLPKRSGRRTCHKHDGGPTLIFKLRWISIQRIVGLSMWSDY